MKTFAEMLSDDTARIAETGMFGMRMVDADTQAVARDLVAITEALDTSGIVPGGKGAPKNATDDDDRWICVNAHDRCYGGAGGPCAHCEQTPVEEPAPAGEGAIDKDVVAINREYLAVPRESPEGVFAAIVSASGGALSVAQVEYVYCKIIAAFDRPYPTVTTAPAVEPVQAVRIEYCPKEWRDGRQLLVFLPKVGIWEVGRYKRARNGNRYWHVASIRPLKDEDITHVAPLPALPDEED